MDCDIQSGTVVLHDPTAGHWLVFKSPLRLFCAHSPGSVQALLREIQHAVDHENLYAAGFLAYEAASSFDPALVVQSPADFPLAWFGLYQRPKIISAPLCPPAPQPSIPWELSVSQEQYHSAIARIKDYIRNGDTYQVNYTIRMQAPFSGEPWSLFTRMVQTQGPHYAAFVDADDWSICCASPELFFRLQGADLVCCPMKGTAPRGLWPDHDLHQALHLQRSEKNRSENVMIVDMVRNDLGRIAEPGSVRVSKLFKIEKFPTLWQMTSRITCATAAPVSDIFQALFPAASITGAPKIRTMQIIAGLETSPRKIYTGSLGFIAPHRRAQFNVAIRTVLVDKRRQLAEYGVGGGIVWDSTPAAEFDECRIKAMILTNIMPDFDLFETILWKPQLGFFLLDYHLRRLTASAKYFSRTFDLKSLRMQLSDLACGLPPHPHRVRLLLAATGNVVLQASAIALSKHPYRVRLASAPIDSQDPFLYHKTTHRQIYDKALAACSGYDDVLLWNEKNEITESSIANVLLKKDNQWLTPPLECGLLPGTYRAFLLETKRIKEGIIRIEDLAHCRDIYLFNSVRGIWKASLSMHA